MRKKTKKKPVLREYSVSVNVNVNSEITVMAESKEDATEKAREQYAKQWKDNSHHGLACPCVDVDFAEGDDVEEVESDDDGGEDGNWFINKKANEEE